MAVAAVLGGNTIQNRAPTPTLHPLPLYPVTPYPAPATPIPHELGIKIQKPACTELLVEARGLRYLFHGS